MKFDPQRHKHEERVGYNLVAARYAAGADQRTALHAALIAAAELAPGQRVLDLASGPGVLARFAAQQVPGIRVVASDLAEQALAEGRRLAVPGAVDAADAPSNHSSLSFVAADAERLTFRDASFERLLCGLGLMFFPDVGAALAEIHRVLKPAGRAVFSVWGEEAEAPLVACALACLQRILPPSKIERLSPFRFGDATLLRQTLLTHGFAEVRIDAHTLHSPFATAAEYWQRFCDLAGSAAPGLARLPAALRERLPVEVAEELAPYRVGTTYRLDSIVRIAVARRL